MLGVLLALVAIAAAVLSFSTLRGLAELCGYTAALAPLLPVVVDAGAAAGSLVWLTHTAGRARAFGRTLAMVLLAGSVAGNALGHGLAAYAARPAWWVVVAVSAVPPAVLGAVVHLAALVAQARTAPADDDAPATVEPVEGEGTPPDEPTESEGGPDRALTLIAAGAGRRRLARELDISEHQARELLERHRAEVAS